MTTQPEGEDSRRNHSLAVSGVVLYQGKALLVRSAVGDKVGEWALPGGYVKATETIDAAIKREIQEEIGIQPQLEGLIAVRNKICEADDENEACFIFLLRASDDNTSPDDIEVDAAQYFAVSELDAIPDLNKLSRLVITQVLEGSPKLLDLQAHPTMPTDRYVIYS